MTRRAHMAASGDDQPSAVAGDGEATTTAIGPEDAGTAPAPSPAETESVYAWSLDDGDQPRIGPDNPDPDGIVSDAHARIRDAELADRYAPALNHLEKQPWQHAADLFTAIEQEHPGDRDAAALLTTAGHNLDAAKAHAAQRAHPAAQP